LRANNKPTYTYSSGHFGTTATAAAAAVVTAAAAAVAAAYLLTILSTLNRLIFL